MATLPKLGAVPRLADLLDDPLKVASLPKEAIAQLRGELAQLDTLLLSRLLTSAKDQDTTEDQLIDVAEAAARLGVSTRYLYGHSGDLSFTRRVGRKLLFSSRGLEKYIRSQ